MRAWVFRNRRRLEQLLERRAKAPLAPPAPPPSEPARTPRVVELQPARRTGTR